MLKATIDPDTAAKIVEKLAPELKADPDIKKIILDVAAAAGEDGEAKYKEFTDKLDEYISDPNKIKEKVKHDIVSTVRWYLYARGRTLYPFLTNIALPRATILATDEEAVWDFYVTKLGLRLRKQTVPLDSAGTSFLLGMGKSGLVIHCSNEQEELPKQYVTISVKRLPALKKRLEEDGIKVSDYEPDVFTDHRSISFEGPDGVRITVVED